ncbi:DUF3883 domain-containing protein [Antribacter gilvus]|uniref:DUF3883 domain-containing protein n=1 Tax=Antribacter gilvus TaxID=2304675 RepID=UPI000F7799DA|nr:DUF3883 domain-containing protein [Antribacter gilvus]
MPMVFLHNTSFAREHDALAFIEQLPQLVREEWFWNIWKTGQKPFGILENGSLVGLVVSWKGHREIAWLATASKVLTDSFDDWGAATKAIARHTRLPVRDVRSEPYTDSKREGDGAKVIVWQALLARPLGIELPAGVVIRRNGWGAVEASELFTEVGGSDDAEDEAGRRPGSAGYVVDADARRLIEMHAVEAVLAWCRENGWHGAEHVGDMGNPYDVVGSLDGRDRRIEVKGTTRGPGSVFVTYNEVEAARDDKDHLLIIVHDINLSLDRDGNLETQGGALEVYDPWLPEPAELVPVTYRWTR